MKGGLLRIINSKSKTFFAFCFCFLIGVACASLLDVRYFLSKFYLLLFILITILVIRWQDVKFRFVLFCILLFTIGICRYILAFPLPLGHPIRYEAGKKEVLEVYVSEEPDIRSDSGRYIASVRWEKRGKIYFKTNLYPQYAYGDLLKITCALEAPQPSEDFRYDMYLARYGVFVVCNKPFVEKIGSGYGNPIMRGLLSVKTRVADHINQLWHEPNASFVAGLLYGYRGGLGELGDLFAQTGVTHIVAVSGSNIVIIASVLSTILIQGLLINRKKAFYALSLGIILFVLFTGASGSVVRAGVMGIISLIAKQMGRMSRIENTLIATATVMVIWNPFILMWDAGFQLSFLSTIGLVYVSPHLEYVFAKFPQTFGIKDTLTQTVAAIIATLPLILFQFGRLSIVAPLVNVLILWTVPWIMLGGAVAVALSFFWQPIAYAASWITGAGLGYVIMVVKFFAALPFASIEIQISWWAMVFMYGLLLRLVVHRTHYEKS